MADGTDALGRGTATEAEETSKAEAMGQAADVAADVPDGDQALPNRLTAAALVLGAASTCLWLSGFLGAGIYGPAAGIACGLAGTLCGCFGIATALRSEGADVPAAVIGMACSILGFTVSVSLTISLVLMVQAISEANDALEEAVTQISEANDAIMAAQAGQDGPSAT